MSNVTYHWRYIRGPLFRSVCVGRDRIANHKTSTVTDVYDRHSYADEDKRIMAALARHVLSLVEGTGTSNVISRGDARTARTRRAPRA